VEKIAAFLIDAFGHALDRAFVGDVGFDDNGVAVTGGDFALHLARFLDVTLGDDDLGAARGERLGESAADALAGAGDDHDFVSDGKRIGHLNSRLRLRRFRQCGERGAGVVRPPP
jgi:hypothetical protein